MCNILTVSVEMASDVLVSFSIAEIMLHVQACAVEKGADLEERVSPVACGKRGRVDFQHETRIRVMLDSHLVPMATTPSKGLFCI